MALTWNWDKKMGYLKYEDSFDNKEFIINIYEGNADMIFIYEFKYEGVEKYQLFNFLCDKQHFKNIVKNEGPEFFKEWKSITLTKIDKNLTWYIEQFYNLGIEVIVRKEKDDDSKTE